MAGHSLCGVEGQWKGWGGGSGEKDEEVEGWQGRGVGEEGREGQKHESHMVGLSDIVLKWRPGGEEGRCQDRTCDGRCGWCLHAQNKAGPDVRRWMLVMSFNELRDWVSKDHLRRWTVSLHHYTERCFSRFLLPLLYTGASMHFTLCGYFPFY